jgi:hypothetical protein
VSTLREAAEEALRWMEHARLHLTIKERMHPDGLGLYDNAAEALRAALAEPEAEPEPVAWQVKKGDDMSTLREAAQAALEQWDKVSGVFRMTAETEALRAALAQPETDAPRDEWRPASDSPDTTRSVLIWLRFGDVETFGKTLGGPSGFAFQNGAITHWRDIEPPTEGE